MINKYIKYGLGALIIVGILYSVFVVIQKNGEYQEQLRTLNQQNEELSLQLRQQAEQFTSNLEAINSSMVFYQEQLVEADRKSERLINSFRNVQDSDLQQCFRTVVPDEIINELNSRN